MVLAPASMAARNGSQFDAVEMFAIAVDCRQVEMRIGAGVAVSREMLCGGQAAVFFDSANERGDEFGDARGIFAEGTRVDDGIVGVAVDIGVGRENPGDAGGLRFQRRDFAHRVGVFRAARRGHGHGMRER